MPIGVAHLREKFGNSRSCGIRGTGKILSLGLHVGKGEGRNIGRSGQGLEAEGR